MFTTSYLTFLTAQKSLLVGFEFSFLRASLKPGEVRLYFSQEKTLSWKRLMWRQLSCSPSFL